MAVLADNLAVSIVLEGLDGVGKSTAILGLADKLGARVMHTPPDSMLGFRSHFDDISPENRERRNAYYEVGNFLAGVEMRNAVSEGKSVVMDRYYASTVAYRVGRCGVDPLPPAGDIVYELPPSLPRPKFMVVLTLPEAARIARRAARTDVAETPEEVVLRMKPHIAERINEAYRRLGCIEVALSDADGPDAVVKKILDATILANKSPQQVPVDIQ